MVFDKDVAKVRAGFAKLTSPGREELSTYDRLKQEGISISEDAKTIEMLANEANYKVDSALTNESALEPRAIVLGYNDSNLKTGNKLFKAYFDNKKQVKSLTIAYLEKGIIKPGDAILTDSKTLSSMLKEYGCQLVGDPVRTEMAEDIDTQGSTDFEIKGTYKLGWRKDTLQSRIAGAIFKCQKEYLGWMDRNLLELKERITKLSKYRKVLAAVDLRSLFLKSLHGRLDHYSIPYVILTPKIEMKYNG